jgi:nucleotide-binding universal stress UspA family protein
VRARAKPPPQESGLRFRSLVVGVDAGPASRLAVHWAALLARLHGSRVHLVSAAARHPSGAHAKPHTEQDADVREGTGDPGAVLARLAAEAKALGITVTTEASAAGPAEAILHAARERSADLVVLGSHGHGRTEFKTAAGVAQAVKNEVAAHVLIARTEPPAAHLLAATDGSARSAHAVAAAQDLAQGLGVPLTIAHVAEQDKAGQTAGRKLADAYRAAGPGTDYVVLHGAPADEIVHAAAGIGAGLVVLGGRGSGGLTALSLGSVSDRVTVYSDSSVLVVKDLAAGGAGAAAR